MTTRQRKKNKVVSSEREHYSGFKRGPTDSDVKWNILNMDFGQKRREQLREWFKTNTLTVNRKYCPLLKYDPDLRRMLKQGILKRGKQVLSAGISYTVLSLA